MYHVFIFSLINSLLLTDCVRPVLYLVLDAKFLLTHRGLIQYWQFNNCIDSIAVIDYWKTLD